MQRSNYTILVEWRCVLWVVQLIVFGLLFPICAKSNASRGSGLDKGGGRNGSITDADADDGPSVDWKPPAPAWLMGGAPTPAFEKPAPRVAAGAAVDDIL